MVIVGLTGSIGMGKSTIAAMFRAAGVPVHDADKAVHALYADLAAGPVERLFPGVVRNGTVDRSQLTERVLNDQAALERLEALVHPMVRDEEVSFLAGARRRGHRMAVLEVPLLLETGSTVRVDVVAVVSTTADTQRARVLARPRMTEARYDQITSRQLPDLHKRRAAHFVVDTSTIQSAQSGVDALLRALAFAV